MRSHCTLFLMAWCLMLCALCNKNPSSSGTTEPAPIPQRNIIDGIEMSAYIVAPDSTTRAWCGVERINGDTLLYHWSVTSGSILEGADGYSMLWQAGSEASICTLIVTVAHAGYYDYEHVVVRVGVGDTVCLGRFALKQVPSESTGVTLQWPAGNGDDYVMIYRKAGYRYYEPFFTGTADESICVDVEADSGTNLGYAGFVYTDVGFYASDTFYADTRAPYVTVEDYSNQSYDYFAGRFVLQFRWDEKIDSVRSNCVLYNRTTGDSLPFVLPAGPLDVFNKWELPWSELSWSGDGEYELTMALVDTMGNRTRVSRDLELRTDHVPYSDGKVLDLLIDANNDVVYALTLKRIVRLDGITGAALTPFNLPADWELQQGVVVPYGSLGFDKVHNHLWVTNYYGNRIAALDAGTGDVRYDLSLLDGISVPRPLNIAFAPNGRGFVSIRNGNFTGSSGNMQQITYSGGIPVLSIRNDVPSRTSTYSLYPLGNSECLLMQQSSSLSNEMFRYDTALDTVVPLPGASNFYSYGETTPWEPTLFLGPDVLVDCSGTVTDLNFSERYTDFRLLCFVPPGNTGADMIRYYQGELQMMLQGAVVKSIRFGAGASVIAVTAYGEHVFVFTYEGIFICDFDALMSFGS